MNGAPCRLLDIQELLSDVGVGRQQHVIISQGQIDAVLNARPEDRRSIIQPSEFIIRKDGSVASSTYSSGPIGRMEPGDALKLIRLYASRES